jgi:hypothetical protein
LQKVTKEYKKGILSEETKKVFAENKDLAVKRAKILAEYTNPSTMIYRLLDKLKS